MPALMWLKAVACSCMLTELFGMIPCMLFWQALETLYALHKTSKAACYHGNDWVALRGADQ